MLDGAFTEQTGGAKCVGQVLERIGHQGLSRVNGDAHARFLGGWGEQFPPATRQRFGLPRAIRIPVRRPPIPHRDSRTPFRLEGPQ